MIPGVEDRYNHVLEELQDKHQLTSWLVRAHVDNACEVKVKELVEQIDNDSKSHMKHAERKCRKIKSGRIPFSPKSTAWIRRCQIYRSVLQFHAGKIRNRR